MSESMTVEQAINVVRSINEVVADKSKLSVAFNAALILSNEVERLSDANIIAEGLKEMAENFISLKQERDGLAAKCAELSNHIENHTDLPPIKWASKGMKIITGDAAVILAKLKADAVREFADQTGDHYVINMAIDYNKANQSQEQSHD